MNNKLKQIMVLKFPRTVILIPFDADEQEARDKWLKKYNDRKSISDQQKKHEFGIVREGKMTQFKNMKR